MTTRLREQLRKVGFTATALVVATALTLSLAPAVSADPVDPTSTDVTTSSTKKGLFDGLKKDKESEGPATVTSINKLKDFFKPPAESVTTPEPEDPNAIEEGRDFLRDEDGNIIRTGKHISQTAAEAQGLYCETSDDLTFAGIAHLVEDEMRKLIKDPTSMKVFDQQVAAFEKAMSYIQVPTIWVSNPATQITGPAREKNDHGVNYVVAALLKARDGGWRSTVAVQDLTINEAIETVLWWFYWVNIYGKWYNDTFPAWVQFNVLDIFKWGLTDGYEKALQFGPPIVLLLGDFIQKQLQKNCLTTKNSRSNPGNYVYHDIPEWLPADFKAGIRKIEEPLDNVEVADEDCPPIADMEYRRVGKRTALLMRENVKPQYRKLYDQSASWVLQRLETVKINKALIPLKGKEIGGLVGLIDNPTVNYIYTLGTAPFDGRIFTWVPVGDVTVDNTLDLAIVANTIARLIASVMWAITKAIMQAIFNGVNNGIDLGIKRAIGAAIAKGDPGRNIGNACQNVAIQGITYNPDPEAKAVSLAALIACGMIFNPVQPHDYIFKNVTNPEDTSVTWPVRAWTVRPVLQFRIWPLPSFEFGIVAPWLGAIPVGPIWNPEAPTEEPITRLSQVPVIGNMFPEGRYIKLLFLFGMEYDIWVNPVPTMFFVGDYLLPIGQGVVQSVCLAEDKGHRKSKWEREEGQIKEDAGLAEKKGVYEAPEAPKWVLFDKWVLPFSKPFWKPDYENLNEDVPEREPMIQRHDPGRVPAQLDPDDPLYKETVEKTPSYTMTYNRGESHADKKAAAAAEAEAATEPADALAEAPAAEPAAEPTTEPAS